MKKFLFAIVVMAASSIDSKTDAQWHTDPNAGGSSGRGPSSVISPYDSSGRENLDTVVDQMPAYQKGYPCTVFVDQVLKSGGYDTSKFVPGTNYRVRDLINLNMFSEREIETQLSQNNPMMKGVVYALTETGQGTEVATEALRSGDVTQYFYYTREGILKGHAAIVKGFDGANIIVKGSQSDGIGEMSVPLANLSRVYNVRPKVSRPRTILVPSRRPY